MRVERIYGGHRTSDSINIKHCFVISRAGQKKLKYLLPFFHIQEPIQIHTVMKIENDKHRPSPKKNMD